jgi:hypothetical protein
MTLQSPVLAGRAGVIDEPPTEHLHAPQVPKELRMIAQLHVIVWRWCCRGSETVWRGIERLA